jgi:Cof subfamily protein (haloacid dehalogenase superfamily)
VDRQLGPDVAGRLPAPPTLFVIDVDGTLLDGSHRVGDATEKQVRRIRDRGVHVLLASSRGPTAMHPILRPLGLLDPAVFIGCQGSLVGSYDAAGVLGVADRRPAPLGPAKDVVRQATAAGLAVSWFAADRWLVSHVDPTIEREAWVVGDTPQAGDLLAEEGGPDKLMIIARDTADLLVLRDLTRAMPPELTAQVSNPTYLEITRSGVDKASALRRQCTQHGVEPASVVAIGDGPNDLGLFAYAGTSVAPANARPEVLAAADWITTSNDDDGVGHALALLVP